MKEVGKQNKAKKTSPQGLVGHFFHTFNENDKVKYQGVIVSDLGNGLYLAALFSWLDGQETCREIFQISEMTKWWFYPDAEAMKFSYEYGVASNKHWKPTKDA